MRARFDLALAAFMVLWSPSVAHADVQPVPSVGSQITITGSGTSCFDSLWSLRASEVYLNKWSDEKMDQFLGAHSIGFYGGEKAKVLAVNPTYPWTNDYGTDHVKPIELRIESSHRESGHEWRGRTCWWEFSQNPDMDLKFTSWKPQS